MSVPPWYTLALAERGVKEATGSTDNPIVQAYYRDAGFPEVRHDSVPWCAAFVGAMLKRAGVKPSGSLIARSYLKWGIPIRTPMSGSVIVLKRGRHPFQGHVGFYVSPGRMLGGNQFNMVSIKNFNPKDVLGYRWPSEKEFKT